jgi:hypothetical protein
VLLSFTYRPEQDVWAWARHTTDGLFRDVGVITSEGQDEVYVLVERTIGGSQVFYVEQLAPYQPEPTAEDAINFDSCLIYNGTATDTFAGLDHLEGKEVYVLGDGDVIGPYTVSGGSVSIGRNVSKATIGLPYNGIVQTLQPETGDLQLQGKRQKALGFSVRLRNSRDIRYDIAGKQFDDGTPDKRDPYVIKFRTDEGYDEGTRVFSGVKVLRLDDSWGLGTGVRITKQPGTPCTILSIGIEFAAYGQNATSAKA